MAVTWQRMQELVKKRASLFNTSYNPLNIRTGASALRHALKGPAVAAYYPPRPVTFKKLAAKFPGYEGVNDYESERLDHIAILKQRGKGAPKKKRTKEESKKAGKKKPGAPKPPPPT